MNVERLHLPDPPGCLFPGAGVVMHWHRPARLNGRSGAGIVCLPIQGGDYDVSTLFARGFARMGFQALRFERRAEWLEADRELSDLARLARQFPADVRAGIDHWLGLGVVDPQRLGLFGVSMGAVMGAAVAGADPRVRASVLCIGGADLPEIVMTADDEEVNQYRKDLAARLGVDEPELRPLLHAALDGLDLSEAARAVDPATSLFFSARFDHVVRWPRNQELWELTGRPRRWVLPCGHYSAVVFVPLIKWLSRRWFDRLLSPPP